MTIIDLANNDDAYILPPIYIVPLLRPFKCHCPLNIFFSNTHGGWGKWGLDVASRGRGLWRGLRIGVVVTNHRTIMADTNRSSNSGPAQQWKLCVTVSPPHPFQIDGSVRGMEWGIVRGQCVLGTCTPMSTYFFFPKFRSLPFLKFGADLMFRPLLFALKHIKE